MSAIIKLAIALATLGAAVTLTDSLLPAGGVRGAARICVGLLYIAAVMENIIGIIFQGGI